MVAISDLCTASTRDPFLNHFYRPILQSCQRKQFYCKVRRSLYMRSLNKSTIWWYINIGSGNGSVPSGQTTGHYPSQCRPRSLSPYGASRPYWLHKPRVDTLSLPLLSAGSSSRVVNVVWNIGRVIVRSLGAVTITLKMLETACYLQDTCDYKFNTLGLYKMTFCYI